MKKLLAILVLGLFLITPSWSDDVRDLQIEGMSVGDSLFDHFSKKEFENAKEKAKIFTQKEGRFSCLLFYNISRFTVYEGVRICWKPKDNDYKIMGLTGHIYYENDFHNCTKKQEEIVSEISKIVEKIPKKRKAKHTYDKTGKTYFNETAFNLSDGGIIDVTCMNWSKEMEKNNNFPDNLQINIINNELNDLLHNAY